MTGVFDADCDANRDWLLAADDRWKIRPPLTDDVVGGAEASCEPLPE